MKFLSYVAIAAIGSVLPLWAEAQAQAQDITAEDVESYVRQIQQDAVEVVEAGDPRQLVGWVERNIAEDATFQVTMSVVGGDEPKVLSSMTLESDDIRRVVGVMAGAFEKEAFQDYSLEAEVTDVVSHGPGAATATVTWHERFTMDPAELLAEGEPTQGSENAVSVDSTATCRHLFRRQDDQLAIGLSTCTAEMRF